LQIDRGQRGRKLAQIGSRGTDLAGELAEAPVCWRDRFVGTGQHQRQALGIVTVRLDMDQCAFDHSGTAAFGPAAHRAGQIVQREISLVIGSREPFRGVAAIVRAARDIDFGAAADIAARIENLHVHGKPP